MQLQSIFAHLLLGKLQAHTPRGFWKDFRLVLRTSRHLQWHGSHMEVII